MLHYEHYTIRRFLLIPFLLELRCLMDWMWTHTTLSVSTWLKVEDIYAQVFCLECWRRAEKVFLLPPTTNPPLVLPFYLEQSLHQSYTLLNPTKPYYSLIHILNFNIVCTTSPIAITSIAANSFNIYIPTTSYLLRLVYNVLYTTLSTTYYLLHLIYNVLSTMSYLLHLIYYVLSTMSYLLPYLLRLIYYILSTTSYLLPLIKLLLPIYVPITIFTSRLSSTLPVFFLCYTHSFPKL